MTHADVERWIEEYVRLWRTPGIEGLGEIFTDDASYSTGPYAEPARGLEAIAALWDTEREPGERFELDSSVVAVEGPVAVARLEVRYTAPREQSYRDLWIMRFAADGRCESFEEWPFWPGQGHVAP
jgi:ketosteroid isomerase-like protein